MPAGYGHSLMSGGMSATICLQVNLRQTKGNKIQSKNC